MPTDALAALRGLGADYAPTINLEADRRKRLREMQRNLELQRTTPGLMVGATQTDVGELEQDIADDPYTGDYEDARVRYQSPFETEKRQTAQSDALAKLLMPERLRSQNALNLERLRQEGALNLQREKNVSEGGDGDLFTSEGQAVAARMVGTSGEMIPGLTRSPKSIAGIVNRIGAESPDINIAANKAEYQASRGSLGALQKTQDAATAFIATADLNAERLIQAMQSAPGIGIPLFDKPIRSAARALGSESMKSIDAIRNSVSQEYSRILSSPGMGGVVTQAERDALHEIFSDQATPGQVLAAVNQLKAEAQNRLQSYAQQIGTVQGRIRGETAAPAPQQYLSGSGWE